MYGIESIAQSLADKMQKPVVFVKTEQDEGEIDSDVEDSSGDLDSDDPTAALIRETKREVAAEQRMKRESKSHHDESSRGGTARRPDGEANIVGLTSLSGGGGGSNMSNMECFKCGQKGHSKANCPKPRGSTGRGRGRGQR